MNTIFNIFLILHIVSGFLGLFSGILNITRKKGDKVHKSIGKVFYFSMLFVGISSLVLAYLHTNYFLFMVGVFTLYMVVYGQRYLKLKQQKASKSLKIEWTISIFMLLTVLLIIGIGIMTILKSNLFGIVFITFGSIGLVFIRQDFINFKSKSTVNNYWLIGHLQRMTGSFIAAFTAFLVVNLKYLPEQLPGFIYWLLPTVLTTPLIIKWSRQYEIKKK